MKGGVVRFANDGLLHIPNGQVFLTPGESNPPEQVPGVAVLRVLLQDGPVDLLSQAQLALLKKTPAPFQVFLGTLQS